MGDGVNSVPVFADATARDAAITSPANGDQAYLTDVGKFTDYTGGSWVQRESGGTFANASTTVAGKVELPTQTQNDAGTATGETGASLTATPAVNALTIQKGTWIWGGTTGGSANAYTATLAPAIAAYATGMTVRVKIHAANTGATTINFNSIGDVAITKNGTVALENADLATNQIIELVYDGTQFQMIGEITNTNLISPTTIVESYTAYEAVTADQAVALLPIEVQYYAQLTDANLALGDSNIRRKYAIKIIPSITSSNLTTMQFRAAEAVNGATTLGNLTISIQDDDGGEPSGTAISNGTANVITQTTQRTWNTTQGSRTATWASPPTLTAGTTYWIVFEVAATDSTNYLNLGVNSSHDENFLTFTRLTFNLDAGTWGGSVTNATPFFWFNSQVVLLGMGLCPTDADWGGRTWNFIGFAKANISANASGLVYTDTVPDLSGLTPGSVYYLSSTVGAITTTKPSNLYDGNAASYEIGCATSSTELQIRRGRKLYYGLLKPTGSATTVHKLITWFPITMMEIQGSYLSTANIIDTTIKGLYDGNSNYARSTRVGDASAPISGFGTGSTETTISFGHDTSAYWQGVGSAKSDVGFTYTVTKTSTPGDYTILYTVEN